MTTCECQIKMKADFVKQEKKLQDYIAKLRNKIKDPEKNVIQFQNASLIFCLNSLTLI